MIKKRVVIWEERSRVQSIYFKAPRRSPVSPPVSTPGWKIQKSAASSQTRRVLSSGPRVNKEREVRGNWMQASASRRVLITQERNNAPDFCGRHQKQRFNQNPETRFDNIQITADWKCFSSHDGNTPTPTHLHNILIVFTCDIEMELFDDVSLDFCLTRDIERREELGCQ